MIKIEGLRFDKEFRQVGSVSSVIVNDNLCHIDRPCY